MAAEIGTPEWIDESNRALRMLRFDTRPEQQELTVIVKITSKNALASYALTLGKEGPRLQSASDVADGVVLSMDRKVADELHSGARSVSDAISEGEIKLGGQVEMLIRAGDMLSQLAKALTQLLE